eukprot:365431-Chlamydomonas_euryale.AAC.34
MPGGPGGPMVGMRPGMGMDMGMPGGVMNPMMVMMGGARAYPGAPPPPPPPPPRRPGDGNGRSRSPRREPDPTEMSYDEYLEAYRRVKLKMEQLKAAEPVVALAAAPGTAGQLAGAGVPRPPLLPNMGVGMAGVPGMMGGMGMLPGAMNMGMMPGLGGAMMGGMGPNMMGGGGGGGIPGMMAGMGPGGMMPSGANMAMMGHQRPQQQAAGAQPYSEAEYVALTIKHFHSQGKQPPSENFIRQVGSIVSGSARTYRVVGKTTCREPTYTLGDARARKRCSRTKVLKCGASRCLPVHISGWLVMTATTTLWAYSYNCVQPSPTMLRPPRLIVLSSGCLGHLRRLPTVSEYVLMGAQQHATFWMADSLLGHGAMARFLHSTASLC